ncbi:MAG: DNA-processing protein DprA [archaeon]|nr:DNA-processing protein DprA [archaeon]
MDTKSETYFHLAILASLGINEVATPSNNIKLRALISRFGSFEETYNSLKPIFSNSLESKLVKSHQEIQEDSTGYGMLVCGQNDFPKQLTDRKTAPVLYYRGNPELLKKERIAVVGTRKDLTPQENQEAVIMLNHIQKRGYVIVSGLARGCDTMGHKAGLSNGTIAVIADPVNDYYLKRNKELMDEIVKNHLLISQFPIGLKNFFHPRYYHGTTLTRRNQTTVALTTKGVVVLKTSDNGGTQYAINAAKDLHKNLYALKCNFIPENTWTSGFNWVDYSICRGTKLEEQEELKLKLE